MAAKYKLNLYVAGVGTDEQKQIIRFKESLKMVFKDQFTLEVVDVLEHPEVAESAKILATPTVIRREPEPSGKFLIDLGNTDNMLKRLALMKI